MEICMFVKSKRRCVFVALPHYLFSIAALPQKKVYDCGFAVQRCLPKFNTGFAALPQREEYACGFAPK